MLMNRPQYEQKILDFLTSAQAVCIPSPFRAYNAVVRSAINNAKFVITGKRQHLLQMNASLPQLYGQKKLHKPNLSIRPVVAFFSDPSYKLARFLVGVFKCVSNFKPQFPVTNSIELTSLLKSRNFPVGSILVSFDIVSMF